MRNGIDEEMKEALLLTKFKQWEYEEEQRLIVPLTQKVGSIYFKRFGDDLVLRSVYIGSRCEVTAAEIARAMSTIENEVTIIKTRPAFTRFEVLKNPSLGIEIVRPSRSSKSDRARTLK